jgi:hypothetical protein
LSAAEAHGRNLCRRSKGLQRESRIVNRVQSSELGDQTPEVVESRELRARSDSQTTRLQDDETVSNEQGAGS